MSDHTKRRFWAAIMLVSLAGGCQNDQSAPSASPNRQSGNSLGTSAGNPARYGKLSAAAEPFEALTEEAFSADPPRLRKLLADVERAAAQIRGFLPAATAAQLEARVADAKAGISDHQPVDTAIGAVEGYRLIVSQFSATAKIPPAVSLLDYAGFRIQADGKASPARWTDAKAALDFAHSQWAGVAGKIGDKDLAAKFQAALDGLGSAIAAKDAAAVSKYAVLELDLVDSLEAYFDPA